MCRGNSARQIVRQRRRRPRFRRCHAKNAAAKKSAAPSDVSEKCEPSEKSSLPIWPKKNAKPAVKSNAAPSRAETGPMSYRRVKIALGRMNLGHQIGVFRMFPDEEPHEAAERPHLLTAP